MWILHKYLTVLLSILLISRLCKVTIQILANWKIREVKMLYLWIIPYFYPIFRIYSVKWPKTKIMAQYVVWQTLKKVVNLAYTFYIENKDGS